MRLTRWLLHWAEVFFLRSHGWVRELDGWSAPLDYPKPHRRIPQGHAVNSQKKHSGRSME